VAGDPFDGSAACIDGYIQADGSLGADPVFQTPAVWGAVSVRGSKILSDTLYQVRTVCGTPEALVHSSATGARTWLLADANNNGAVDLDDVLLTLAAFSGGIDPQDLPTVDSAPCAPDGAVDLDDLLTALTAFAGAEPNCPLVCLPGACCFLNSTCRDDLTQTACELLGGFPKPEGTACEEGACRGVPALSHVGTTLMSLLVVAAGVYSIRRRLCRVY
jgi:hypothetical protein